MTFKGTLREFQEDVVERMISEQSLLVALDLGLGKTIISIYVCEALIESGEASGGLIVVPASLKYQWKARIDEFTGGDAVVLVIDGDREKRLRQYRLVREGQVEYTLLNYEQVVNDWDIVQHLPMDWLICDEAQALKNETAKRTKRIMKLQPKYRYALTGRPIETRPEEVFNIMRWVDPEVLGTFDVFDRTFIKRDYFGRVKYYKNLSVLHQRLNSAMVRVPRKDVEDQLPKVAEETVLVDFDIQGAKLYRAISKELLGLLAEAVKFGTSFDLYKHYHGSDDSEANALRGQIMSRVVCLRMLCDHPELLRISAEKFAGSQVPGSGIAGGSMYAAQLQQAGLLAGLKKAPKFDAALELVEEIVDSGAKLVVFSFFKATLDIFQHALESKGVGSAKFTGDQNAHAKDVSRVAFEEDDQCRVLLASDAGGAGLDLPVASYLLNFDLPWSAGKLDQRNGRIVRLSSKHASVTVLNTLMAGSIEERQYEALKLQRAIASAVVDGQSERIDSQGRLNITLATLSEYLRSATV